MKITCLISGKTWDVRGDDDVSVTDGWYVVKFKNKNTLMFHESNQTMKVEK